MADGLRVTASMNFGLKRSTTPFVRMSSPTGDRHSAEGGSVVTLRMASARSLISGRVSPAGGLSASTVSLQFFMMSRTTLARI